MSKKKSLNEANVGSRWLELAGKGHLKESFEKVFEAEDDDMEDPEVPELEADSEEEELDLEIEDEPSSEMPEPDMEAPTAGGAMVSVDEFMAALRTALESTTGEEVEVEMDGASEPSLEGDMEADEEMPDLEEMASRLAESITKRLSKKTRVDEAASKIADLIQRKLNLR